MKTCHLAIQEMLPGNMVTAADGLALESLVELMSWPETESCNGYRYRRTGSSKPYRSKAWSSSPATFSALSAVDRIMVETSRFLATVSPANYQMKLFLILLVEVWGISSPLRAAYFSKLLNGLKLQSIHAWTSTTQKGIPCRCARSPVFQKAPAGPGRVKNVNDIYRLAAANRRLHGSVATPRTLRQRRISASRTCRSRGSTTCP